MNAGGKGANQAVAAQRLGGNVTLIAKTGNDIFGTRSRELFKEEGIQTDFILVDPVHPSGVALITVDKNAENTIVVASGANSALTPADLKNATEVITNATLVVMQLEIPLDTVQYVAFLASAKNVPVILNPAPACSLPASLFRNISVITPNQKEAEMLTGIVVTDEASAKEAAQVLTSKGAQTVVITLGAKGALIYTKEINEIISAPAVEAVDTTAAGDVFTGALAVGLSENRTLRDAVFFACHAAALSVTKLGAQASAPSRQEVLESLGV